MWRVGAPIPRPVETVRGPIDTYEHVVVTLTHGGITGWGASAASRVDLVDAAAAHLAAQVGDALGGLGWLAAGDSIAGAVGGDADVAARHAADNALALAAWDFVARRRGIAVAELWGAQRGRIPAYASGLFVGGDVDDLLAEARSYVDAGFRYVKMRAGRGPVEDAERLDAVAAVVGAGCVAIDAVQASTPAEAGAFAERVTTPLLWYEDPAPYAELGELSGVDVPIAAGESLLTLAELVSLHDRARVDIALLDLRCLGGPSRFLAAARVLAGRGAQVGSHVHTAHSIHLLACLPASAPVEVFDWSDALMVEPPRLGRDGHFVVRGPGFGVELSWTMLRRFGHLVHAGEFSPGRVVQRHR